MKFLEKYGINFKESKLLKVALTHSSYSYGKHEKNYERLEFLGDSVLSMIVSDYLYSLGTLKEGVMSKKRASYVCETALDYYASKINLRNYIFIGQGLELNDTITADVFEAVLAVIYLEKGIEVAREFIHDIVIPEIACGKEFFSDYKTLMQEYCQTTKRSIVYVIKNEYGESHDKTFEIDLVIDDIIYGSGTGKSKKEAEQRAAENAYKKSVK